MFFDAVKRICFVSITSLFFNISPSPRTNGVPLGTLVIYIIWGFLCVTKNCHGDEGCPRADCNKIHRRVNDTVCNV